MFKVSIFDKYIFKQVFLATIVCLLLFIIVWIAPETLVKIIKKIFKHTATIMQAWEMLMWELPKVLSKAIPVGILLGTIFTFDKLSKDSELSILRGIGLSFTRIMVPAIILGCGLSFVCFFVGDRLIPAAAKAEGENDFFKNQYVYVQKDAEGDLARSIIVTLHIPHTVKDIFVVDFSKRQYEDAATFDTISYAPWAEVLNDKWILHNTKRYHIDENGIYGNEEYVDKMEILQGDLSQKVYELMNSSVRRDRSFTNAELKRYMKLLKEHDHTDEHRFMLAKYYQRFLHPLTCILFAIIGCMLGFSPPRSQRLVGFTIAVGIIFAYYITLPFFDLLAQKGIMPPFLASSFPIILFIITIYAIKKYKDL